MTGAQGFVGSALVQTLLNAGARVRAIVRTGSILLPNGLETVAVGDLSSPAVDLASAVADCDAVVHLAGRAHNVDDAKDTSVEELYRRANTVSTRNIAEACAAAGVGRVLYVSSIKVYGDGDRPEPITGATPTAPSDAYGRSKLAAERELGAVAKEAGFEVVIVRPPLVYGPGVRANFLRLMRLVDSGIPLPFGAVANRRSLIYLGNLTGALTQAVKAPGAVGEPLLLSDREAVSTAELSRRMADALDRRPRLLTVPPSLLSWAGGVTGQGDLLTRLLGSLYVSSDRDYKRLYWTPPYSMEAGLRETVAWYRAI